MNSAGIETGRGGSRQRKARLPARQGLTGPLRPSRLHGRQPQSRVERGAYDGTPDARPAARLARPTRESAFSYNELKCDPVHVLIGCLGRNRWLTVCFAEAPPGAAVRGAAM